MCIRDSINSVELKKKKSKLRIVSATKMFSHNMCHLIHIVYIIASYFECINYIPSLTASGDTSNYSMFFRFRKCKYSLWNVIKCKITDNFPFKI